MWERRIEWGEILCYMLYVVFLGGGRGAQN